MQIKTPDAPLIRPTYVCGVRPKVRKHSASSSTQSPPFLLQANPISATVGRLRPSLLQSRFPAVRPKRLIYEASQPASPPLRLPADLRAPLICISPSDLHPPSNTHQTTSRRAKENKTNASNSRGSCHNHHSSLASNSITATTPHPRISPCTF